MSQQACCEAAMSRQVALLESSYLLTNSQRGALSGPNKDAADKTRAIFEPMAKAAIFPYLGPDAGGDSTLDLPDHFATQFPAQLQFFFPDEQRSRLVRSTMFVICLTSQNIFFPIRQISSHHLLLQQQKRRKKVQNKRKREKRRQLQRKERGKE